MNDLNNKISAPDLSHEELMLLLRLGERLVVELDLENVLTLVAEAACEVVQAETLVVPMIDKDWQTFTYRAASGEYAATVLGQTFPIHTGACGWVLLHQRPLLFGEGGSFDLDSSAEWQPGMASSLLVPLICRGKIIGGLSAMGKRGNGAFNLRNQQVLTLFAHQASVAIDNARLFQQLGAEESRLRLVLDSVDEGICGIDLDGNFTFANPACQRMLGYTSEAELIGKPVHAMIHHSYPDGNPFPYAACHVHRSIQEGNDSHSDTELYWRSDGTSFPVEYWAHPKLQDGKIAGAVVTFIDITERKQTEAALQYSKQLLNSIIENIPNMIFLKRASDLRFEMFNLAGENLLGMGREELIGKNDFDFFPHEQAEFFTGKDRAVLQQGGLLDIPEETINTAHGARILHTKKIALKDTQGNPQFLLGISEDITERKRNEEKLRQYKDHLEDEVQRRTADLVLARNAAEAANQAKSVFLANMSHELRTPLNAILGFSNMMQKDQQLPEILRQNVDIINRSGEHLLTLINDVLEMAKIEAGRIQLENVPFDLGAMVRDVTDMMQMRAREKGLQLLIDQSSLFPRYIVGDEGRLRQTLINLIGNAVKFTQQGGITLRLGTKKNTIPHLLIEVEDSGPGIALEDQQRIFEPFVQLGEHGINKGTGLGLTITRQFVQMMGGNLSLESSPGKGSLFRVDLPLNEVAETDMIKSQQAGHGEVVELAPGHPPYRILIVEDQRDNQLLLTKLMESVGFQVKLAENGELGIKLFQDWHPHFIWMDRRMPVMDGMEATRQIRTLPGGKEVKIVAVTASAFTEQRTEMLDAGMDDFVRKPYRSNEIYDCLAKHLGVKYLYEGEAELQETSVTLTPDMLEVLPQALRNDLKAALESLDSERIGLIIGQVAAYDLQLQNTLTRLTDNFDYPAILRTLQKN